MKTYICHRCGKPFKGRYDRCPYCGQLFVYARGGHYYDALGNEVILDKNNHIKKRIPNKLAPQPR